MSMNCMRGHFVNKVTSGSASEKAGIEHGDLIVAINGKNIKEKTHQQVVELLQNSILNSKYGDELIISVIKKPSDTEKE